ncbi:MAG TPA: urease accessory protein UreD [Acidimicrobiales bacterium]|nr:urease accessory protein UreD [Acidimicrobiales bacterium]
MIARLQVAVEGSRVVRLSASPPLGAKVLDGPCGPELVLVGSAASLLEGDRLVVALELGVGARLTVRTAAAALAHPCPGGGSTAFDVRVDLAAGARLGWLPEPLVACAGCRHAGTARVRLAGGAMAVWSETVALGRSGEPPGDVALRFDADLDGAALLRDGLRLGPSAPGWDGPAVADGARHVGTLALLGAAWAGDPLAGSRTGAGADGDRARATSARGGASRTGAGAAAGDGAGDGLVGVLRLAGPGTVVRALGGDGASVARRLAGARRAFLAALLGADASPNRASPTGHIPGEESRQEMVM